MLRLLWDPSDAILDIKRKRNYLTVISALFLNAVFLGLSAAFFAWLKMPLQNALLLGTGVGVGLIILSVYCGVVAKFVMQGLTSNGDYFSGLTSMVYPYVSFSVGTLIMSISSVWIVAMNNQVITLVLTALNVLLVPLLIALSCAALFRCMKELFDTNMLTALVGLLILKLNALFIMLIICAGFMLFFQGNTALLSVGLSELYIVG